MNRISLAILGSVILAAQTGPALAGGDGDDDDGCQRVLTAVHSSIDTTNCPSVCTSGQLGGPAGLLHAGTTHFVIATLDTSTPIWKYTGRFDLTTAGGTLSVFSTGTIDFTVSPPTFSETEAIIGGTGVFQDAVSRRGFVSTGTFDGTTFLGTIAGKICTRDGDR
jgi:hypothetical protein